MRNGGVDAGPRVSVPVPYASVIRAAFQQFDVVAGVAENLELVDAAEACADDHCIEVVFLCHRGGCQ